MEKSKINKKGMIKWGLGGGVLFGLIFGSLIADLVHNSNMFFVVLIFFIILFGLIGAKSKTKEERDAYKKSLFISNEGLSKNEKIAAWVLSIINPIITGSIMYYMWVNKYPEKAKKSNRISFIIFAIYLIPYIYYVTSFISDPRI